VLGCEERVGTGRLLPDDFVNPLDGEDSFIFFLFLKNGALVRLYNILSSRECIVDMNTHTYSTVW